MEGLGGGARQRLSSRTCRECPPHAVGHAARVTMHSVGGVARASVARVPMYSVAGAARGSVSAAEEFACSTARPCEARWQRREHGGLVKEQMPRVLHCSNGGSDTGHEGHEHRCMSSCSGQVKSSQVRSSHDMLSSITSTKYCHGIGWAASRQPAQTKASAPRRSVQEPPPQIQ
jgi:hypothetical protein